MSVLGHGIYGYSEVARFLGEHPNTVRNWFCRRSKGTRPVLHGRYSAVSRIGFLDLVEALVVSNLRDRGVSMPTVRKAYKRIAKLLDTRYPFSHQGLYTDGRDIFVDVARQGEKEGLVDAAALQHVFPALREHLDKIDYDTTSRFAAQWHIAVGVVIDPRRRFGKPIVDNCGLSTSILAAAFRANHSDASTVADWYGVSVHDVENAVAFERSLRHHAA